VGLLNKRSKIVQLVQKRKNKKNKRAMASLPRPLSAWNMYLLDLKKKYLEKAITEFDGHRGRDCSLLFAKL